MRKLAALILLAAASAFSQNTPTVIFTPFGPWITCEDDPGLVIGPLNPCAIVDIKGSEPDLLSVKAGSQSTNYFMYLISGTDTAGVSKTVTGVMKRKDNSAGFTSTIINAGFIKATVTVSEYNYNPDTGDLLFIQTWKSQ